MDVTEHRRVQTIYFIPVGQGRAFELLVRCPDCSSIFVRPVDHYPTLVDEPGPVEELAERTNPPLLTNITLREHAEAVAMVSDAGSDDRLTLFAEMIGSLEADAVRRKTAGRYESVTVLVAGGAILTTGPCAVLVLGVQNPPLVWTLGLGVLAVVFWIWLVYRIVRGQSKARARSVEQRIARTIAPYDPTDDELRAVRKKLARAGSTVAQGLDLTRLRTLIESELDSTLPE